MSGSEFRVVGGVIYPTQWHGAVKEVEAVGEAAWQSQPTPPGERPKRVRGGDHMQQQQQMWQQQKQQQQSGVQINKVPAKTPTNG